MPAPAWTRRQTLSLLGSLPTAWWATQTSALAWQSKTRPSLPAPDPAAGTPPPDLAITAEALDAFDPGSAQRLAAPVELIPFPRQATLDQGVRSRVHQWEVQAEPALSRAIAAALRLNERFPHAKPGSATAPTPLQLKLAPVDGAPPDQPEAYHLIVNTEGAFLHAATEVGLLRGLATLAQLTGRDSGEVALAEITDWPALPLRGFLHDTGRHFQELATLKRFVQVLADYQFNLFHWHLTDFPGYRIESRRYPELNDPKTGLPARHPGRFYSFEEIRELFRFAWARGLEILPEIDMPGHSEYFQKAFGFGMQDPRGQVICADLLDEFCTEIVLPLRQEGVVIRRLHLGADEVKITNPEFLPAMAEVLRGFDLEIVGWHPGGNMPGIIDQLWNLGTPRPGVPYLDSAVSYINNIDHQTGIAHAFFRQSCPWGLGADSGLGAILCHWPDIAVSSEKAIYSQSPVMPMLLACAERFWRGLPEAAPDLTLAAAPPNDPRQQAFARFEQALGRHLGRLNSEGWPTPWAPQARQAWSWLGPVPADFEFDPTTQPALTTITLADGTTLTPKLAGGSTLNFRDGNQRPALLPANARGIVWAETWIWSPRNQTVLAWLGVDFFPRSARIGGPVPAPGQWNNDGGQIWLGGQPVPAPTWQHAGYQAANVWHDETPLVDEGYAYRPPTEVALKAGWNRLLIRNNLTDKGYHRSLSAAFPDQPAVPNSTSLHFAATPPVPTPTAK